MKFLAENFYNYPNEGTRPTLKILFRILNKSSCRPIMDFFVKFTLKKTKK